MVANYLSHLIYQARRCLHPLLFHLYLWLFLSSSSSCWSKYRPQGGTLVCFLMIDNTDQLVYCLNYNAKSSSICQWKLLLFPIKPDFWGKLGVCFLTILLWLNLVQTFHSNILIYINLCLLLQGIPQVLLCRVPFLKELLLLPALTDGDEKVIGGLACLMSEIGQAVSA